MERMRLVLSSVLALGAAVLMRAWGGELPWALWLPTGLLAATALLVHHRRLTSQLLARAALWSNLGLGFLIATSGSSTERDIAAGLAVCTGGALLLLGRRGLDVTDPFAPVAFKTTIFTLLLLALADVQALTFFAGIMTETRDMGRAVVPFILAAMLGVGLFGLYRLRVWGLAAHVVANLTLAGAVASRGLGLPTPLLAALAVSATLQIALALPLIAGLVRGRARPEPAVSRLGSVIAGLVVLVLVGCSVASAIFLQGPLIRWN
jgi:hypothetical protein